MESDNEGVFESHANDARDDGNLKPASNDFAYFSQLFPKFNLIRCATAL